MKKGITFYFSLAGLLVCLFILWVNERVENALEKRMK